MKLSFFVFSLPENSKKVYRIIIPLDLHDFGLDVRFFFLVLGGYDYQFMYAWPFVVQTYQLAGHAPLWDHQIIDILRRFLIAGHPPNANGHREGVVMEKENPQTRHEIEDTGCFGTK